LVVAAASTDWRYGELVSIRWTEDQEARRKYRQEECPHLSLLLLRLLARSTAILLQPWRFFELEARERRYKIIAKHGGP